MRQAGGRLRPGGGGLLLAGRAGRLRHPDRAGLVAAGGGSADGRGWDERAVGGGGERAGAGAVAGVGVKWGGCV